MFPGLESAGFWVSDQDVYMFIYACICPYLCYLCLYMYVSLLYTYVYARMCMYCWLIERKMAKFECAYVYV